ncbi:putative polyA polymerase [Mycobacterium xenopi 4042]|uniref:Putative polyA polymerase n=1 Tax=Mycobacterium xenopi 4042 TaxID=1299334 RepID=X8CL81_MYCXE|nr:putative polyA polymerase [Mycobacterium xenopi 4042]
MAVRITPTGPGEFVDPLGGLAALRAGVLDTPSAPQESFADDPLRMLRAARFVSQLGFTVAPRVRAAIEDMARSWPASLPSGWPPNWTSYCSAETRWPVSTSWCRPGWAKSCCPRSVRCEWPSTNTINTKTSTSIR